MDGSRFDDLTRAFGRGTSRRRLFKGVVGGLASLVAGGAITQKASARTLTICHATGNPDAPWESLVIDQSEFNLHARHGDYLRVECCANGDCATLDGVCAIGTCQNGYCVQLPTAAGTPCDDQQSCTIGSVCDGALSCGGGSLIACPETENPCSTSVCSEAAQGCIEAILDDGSACGASDACFDFTCLSGVCHARPKDSCVGNCADCSGTCVNLNADLNNCGSCGAVCPDLGKCLTTTCQAPGICLNTPVACPGGDQCNTAACDPTTGCYLQPKFTAACQTAAGNNGQCGEDGVCHPICSATVSCENDDQCGTGRLCLNGGCFRECESGDCSTECANCFCSVTQRNPVGRRQVCADAGFGIGACTSSADCPQGSYCNPSFGGGSPGVLLCTRPCPETAVG